MDIVKDLKWKKGIKLDRFVAGLANTGYQGVELGRASEVIVKMKRDKAKIFMTFTSNMVTSGLRGFFAQLIKLGMVDVIITTVGGIEEDIMRATGEKFMITSFNADDVELYEKGMNRIGNLLVSNDSYARFEDTLTKMLGEIYKKKKRIKPSELFREIGLMLNDKDSLLYQAAHNNVPIFCPAITDGAFGFHLFFFQQNHDDFIVDIVKDFSDMLTCTSYDERKGIIALGGGVSKHYAILITLINGGFDYGVYITSQTPYDGSMSGATTDEAKSWGKIKDNADAVTVIGDATVYFPLAMMRALEVLSREGLIKNG
ncbi:deoxyhypusine synthase [Candidatus Woesearchaeota archaeon]|nr:MAG: deoxyhypusine synthase [Candidatus Woesearchaeota archaeon]